MPKAIIKTTTAKPKAKPVVKAASVKVPAVKTAADKPTVAKAAAAKPAVKPAVIKTATQSKPVAKYTVTKTVDFIDLPNDFVACAEHDYQYALGKVVASGFSGFLAGIVVTSLIWIVVVNVFFVG